jgi:hypothetical protein
MQNIVDLESLRKSPSPTRASTHTTVVLNDAAARVRQIEVEIETAEGEACRLAMDVGDVLAPIKRTIGHGRWLPFLKNCSLSARVAQIRMQLAGARSVIEAANANRQSHLSVAEALKLIRPKKTSSKQPHAKPKAAPVAAMTIADVLEFLSKASWADKRRVAAALAQDAATMRKILPALSPKATPKQVYDRAMSLLSPREAPDHRSAEPVTDDRPIAWEGV